MSKLKAIPTQNRNKKAITLLENSEAFFKSSALPNSFNTVAVIILSPYRSQRG